MIVAGLCCLQFALHAAVGSRPDKAEPSSINALARAKAHFSSHFEYAHDAVWYHTDGHYLYCLFYQGDSVNRVYYDRRGKWEYSLLTYPGYDLPQEVKKEVTDNFACYQITSVNEIRSSMSSPVYMINIENEDYIKVIKVIGDEVEVQQELEKR